MRRLLAIAFTAALGLLSLLALDDITTGCESSLVAEWTTLAATAVWLAVLAAVGLRRRG